MFRAVTSCTDRHAPVTLALRKKRKLIKKTIYCKRNLLQLHESKNCMSLTFLMGLMSINVSTNYMLKAN